MPSAKPDDDHSLNMNNFTLRHALRSPSFVMKSRYEVTRSDRTTHYSWTVGTRGNGAN